MSEFETENPVQTTAINAAGKLVDQVRVPLQAGWPTAAAAAIEQQIADLRAAGAL